MAVNWEALEASAIEEARHSERPTDGETDRPKMGVGKTTFCMFWFILFDSFTKKVE